jgi:NADPH:quinone reductase-like Zn-dependent oxidoreductase
MADSASFAHAAAIAWQMLFKVGRLERGETVLIIGNGTPVGRLAAQFATIYEVRTVVMTSQDDAVVPRDVDRVIDATAGCLEAQSRLAALIVDTVGGPAYRRACKAMRTGSMLVSCVERPSASSRVGVQFHRVARASAACLSQMVALLDAGRVEFDAS